MNTWEAQAPTGITKMGIAEMVWEGVDGDGLVQSRHNQRAVFDTLVTFWVIC